MVKLNFNKQLSASSIVESLVAIVVLSITFGVGIMIYFNVLTNSAIPVKTKAIIVAEKIATQTKANERYLNETLSIQNLDIKKRLQKYNYGSNLYTLSIEIYQNKKLIYTHNELISNIER